MRSLLKQRGVLNVYVPHPDEPRAKFIIKREDMRDILNEPMINLEDLEPDFLEKIIESVESPPFVPEKEESEEK